MIRICGNFKIVLGLPILLQLLENKRVVLCHLGDVDVHVEGVDLSQSCKRQALQVTAG